MKNILNSQILNMATKLNSGNSDTVAMHTRSFRMGVVTGLLLIAGLLPMLADAQPTSMTLTLDPAEVTESADPTTITVTVTLVGGTFGVDRRVRFQTALVGSASPGNDFKEVPETDLTILANMESGSVDIMFTAIVDEIEELDGEGTGIRGNLLAVDGSVDTSISRTFTTLTINDPAPAFTNMAMFTTPIDACLKTQTAVGASPIYSPFLAVATSPTRWAAPMAQVIRHHLATAP